MNTFTLTRRNITIIASYLLLTALFFSLGLFIGFHNNNSPITEQVSANANNTPQNTLSPTVVTESPSVYRVILEDGELRLYSDCGGTSRLISGEAISEDAYPVSDIAALKKGVVFSSLDGAASLIENFIS